jgi:hypothetical protein
MMSNPSFKGFSFGRVMNFKDSRQCPSEYETCVSCQMYLLFYFYIVTITHVGRRRTYIQWRGMVFKIEFVRINCPTKERQPLGHPS